MESNLINESTEVNVYALKPLPVDVEWFEREGLKKLFLDKGSALDLNLATFSKPMAKIKWYIAASMNHNVDCVASVGYGKSDTAFWQPYKGPASAKNVFDVTLTDNSVGGVAVERKYFIKNYLIGLSQKSDESLICDVSELGIEPLKLSDELLSRVYETSIEKFEFDYDSPLKSSIPGDVKKDIRVIKINESSVNFIDVVASLEYIIEGEYRGEKFEIVLMANDEHRGIEIMYPPTSFIREGKGEYKLKKLEGFRDEWWK
ncbi:MAG: hypothetical protein J6D23_07980 [Clostridia bacterium]|nr:hypothetical protein [Clostridia bacterium]